MTDLRDELEIDKESLSSALRAKFDRTDRRPNLPDVRQRHRVHRRRTWVARASVAIAAVLGIALATPVLNELRVLTDRKAPVTAPGGIPDDRAATFAIRAIAQADMMNPGGSFYSYHSTERNVDGWVLRFASSECIRTETLETCRGTSGEDEFGRPKPDTQVTVGVAEDGKLRVSSIERSTSPVPEENRDRLMAYAESPDTVEPHPEFAPLTLEQGDPQADGDSLTYQAASYWAGPIPDHRLTFGCFARAYDADGAVVYESDGFAYESPEGESLRGGGILSSGFPASTQATSVEMVCDEFTGPGWELSSTPKVHQPQGAAHVRVRAGLVWRQRGLFGVVVSCTTTVLSSDGTQLGELTQPRSAPTRGSENEPPFHDQLDVIVDVTRDGTPTEATFACVVPSPSTREPDELEDAAEPNQDEETRPLPAAEPPEGPRELIATGSFEGAEWGELDGEEWWLEAWQVEGYRCWAFTMIDRGGIGRSCESAEETPVDSEYIGSSGSTPGLRFDANRTIIYGELREEVSYIEIRLSSGQTYRIDAVAPDPAHGIDARYYVAFVEPAEGYSVSAYDHDGILLQDRNFNR